MEEQIIISNEDHFQKVKAQFLQRGYENIHVLADFDKTLTKAFVDGKKTQSIVAELRNGDYLDEDYQQRAHALFNQYHPIEVDSTIPLQERKESMHEWWRKHFELIIEKKLQFSTVKRLVQSGNIRLRDGVKEFLTFLHEHNIPLVILSAGAIGEAISLVLERDGVLYPNISIVSNQFIWNDEGLAVGIKEPIVHSMNKAETTIHHLPHYSDIERRRHVLLLGDGLGDVHMIEGFSYESLLKVGFLAQEDIPSGHKEAYDVIITNDGSFNFVNQFMKGIQKKY